MKNLLVGENLVEMPFIIATIGGYTFGKFSKDIGTSMNVSFPNMLNSLTVQKVNGLINNYSLQMIYAIRPGDDPNMIEKILGISSQQSRIMSITYGDYSQPNYIYRDEEAMITNITSQIDFKSSKITYNISAVSTAYKLQSASYDFETVKSKPSDEIKKMLSDAKYGLSDIFKGMNSSNIDKYIKGDDIEVDIPAMTCNPITRISKLVSYMQPPDVPNNGELGYSTYTLKVVDDRINGAHFEVRKVNSSAVNSNIVRNASTYEVNIGYPDDNYVVNFAVNNENVYSILYNYNGVVNTNNNQYRINDDGKIEVTSTPIIATNRAIREATAASKNWWNAMTTFPVTATLTLKGLLKPSILMDELHIHSYFYGVKHTSSGVYVITKHVDTIDSSGYRTVLNLTRIGGSTIDN